MAMVKSELGCLAPDLGSRVGALFTERVGGGDAFNGAMLHAIMSGMPLGEATVFAISAFALKHIIKGDTFTLGEEDIVNYRKVLEECSE